MLQFVLMIGFSLYLTAYGAIALFRREWIVRLGNMVSRSEETLKGSAKVSGATRILAIASLVLGVIGLIVSSITLYYFIRAQNGVINV